MIIPAEITAAISVLQFWPETNSVPLAAYITIFFAAITLGNIFHVKIYGYIEYYMSFIKCAAVILMIFFMFIMTSGGIPATNGPIEFRYWKNPGAFRNGIKGIAKAFIQAAFSFGGGEHIAVIAGEVANPRSTIKKTIRPVFWRMFTFFVVNIWLVGMCIPSDDSNLATASGTLGSPFVIAIQRAGVPGLAHAINGFIFLSVVSCGITSAYVASRSLTALADIRIVHPIFGWKDKQGRPLVALAISLALGGGLCYLNVDSVGTIVYGWFTSLVSKACQFRRILKSNIALGRDFDPIRVVRLLHCPSEIPTGPQSSGERSSSVTIQGISHSLCTMGQLTDCSFRLWMRILSILFPLWRERIRKDILFELPRCSSICSRLLRL